MTTRVKASPALLGGLFTVIILICLVLAFLFPLNVRAEMEAIPPAVKAPAAPLIWTLEHGTVTLLSTPCDNAAVKSIITDNGLGNHGYQTAAIRWDGRDVAGCWALFADQGQVCIIDEEGQHGDVDVRNFKPLTSVKN